MEVSFLQVHSRFDYITKGEFTVTKTFTVVIQREEEMYVALCPELDIASQGVTVQEARNNVREAIELFLEDADPQEVEQRMHDEQYVSSIEVAVG